MYEAKHFAEDRIDVQHALIRQHPLGLLICNGADGRINANPVPFLLLPDRGELGVLRAHVARENPQWRQIHEADDCLVVFQGPEAYVSPNWYPSKQGHGRVVPTWNYVTVHVRGVPSVSENAQWLHEQVERMTDQQEATQSSPWEVTDAPQNYTRALLKAIVGIEIRITEIQGKWKLSQNRKTQDIVGVHEGLTGEGHTALADQVADHIHRS
ncbi:MAG: FMN-binding negative transcriptional regulator [Pseudomonadota bacterium]